MEIITRDVVYQDLLAQGQPVALTAPIHHPKALLRAFGFQVMELWDPRGGANAGPSRSQAYICSVVGNILAFLTSGRVEGASLLLVPHSCDSLQGLGSILRDFSTLPFPVLTMYMPRGVRSSDQDFLFNELTALRRRLEDLTGETPSDQEIHHYLDLEEDADDAVRALFSQGAELASPRLYEVIRTREYLPAEDFIRLARELRPGAGAPSPATRLILSGILPGPQELLETLETAGARVVGDDLACCGRRIAPPVQHPDPLKRMAARLLAAPPDPMRGSPIQERIDRLFRLIDGSRAQGVLFTGIKYCEPELFDLPLVRSALDGRGVPSLVLELEAGARLGHQTINRIEAFLEMLS